MAIRIDTVKLDSPKLDQNGYLKVSAAVTRTGVFVYKHPDGSTTRELRHPDDVFNKDSLKTLENRPVTSKHPLVGRLDPDNTKYSSVGNVTGEIKHDNKFVQAELLITDAGAIKDVSREENPIREISCAYDQELIKQDGVFNGEQYDHVQKNIIYNHVAIVERGRAGPEVRLNLDAADAVILLNEPEKRKTNMTTLKIKCDAVETRTFKTGSLELKIDGTQETAELALEKMIERFDSAISAIRKVESENQNLKGRLDAMGEQGKISASRLDDLVQERTDALQAAHYLSMKNYEQLETVDLKKAIVLKSYPDMKQDDITADYIEGRYGAIIDRIKQDNSNIGSLANLKTVATNPDLFNKDREDALSPREKLSNDLQDWHSKPTEELRKLA